MVLSLPVSLSVCFITTNLVEATTGDLPMEPQCDPNENENCDVIKVSTNESVIAKDTADSDQTRPSDSIKIDQDGVLSEEEVQEDEEKSDSKLPTAYESTYDVSITFDDITFEKSGRMNMYFYVNGRIPYMNGNSNVFNVQQAPTNVDRQTQTTFDLAQENYIYRGFPVDEPLAIMIGGYIKNPQCNMHPVFSFAIDAQIFAANADKNQLLEFQKSLIPKDRITCFVQNSLNPQIGSIVSHEVMGYVSELYDPLSFPNNEIQVSKSSIDTGPPDFKVNFKMKITPSNAIGPSE